MLKAINSNLYEPGYFLGWYPPLVSKNQIRGTWTEPAYFAIWLAFAVPFFVSYFLQEGVLSLKKAGISFVFFTTLFSIWFMTYARTSVVLMSTLVALYLFFAVIFRSRENWERIGIIIVTMLLGFLIVSTCGPQEGFRDDRLQSKTSIVENIEDSTLFQNTVKSSVDSKSRSNPTRLQDFRFKIEVFKDYPIAGAGDTFLSVVQIRKMRENSDELTRENRQRLVYTNTRGLFQSGINGSSLSIAGILASRGILGFCAIFVPIMVLGLSLFVHLFAVKKHSREIGITIFTSCAGSFLAAFSQGLWYYYFWASAGLALAFLLQIPREQCAQKSVETLKG